MIGSTQSAAQAGSLYWRVPDAFTSLEAELEYGGRTGVSEPTRADSFNMWSAFSPVRLSRILVQRYLSFPVADLGCSYVLDTPAACSGC